MINDFDTLLKRCEAKRKKWLIKLYGIGVFTVSLIGIVGWIGFARFHSTDTLSSHSEQTQIVSAHQTERNITEANETNRSVLVHPNTIAAKPVLPSPLAPKPTALTPAPMPQQRVDGAVPPAPTVIAPQPIAPAAVPPPTPPKKNLFEVTTQPQTLEGMIAFYKTSPQYETALTIAKEYYAKGSFAEAAIWAKKANQLNREEEEAWLLYAKSYYAQGMRAEAINVLELFLNYKNSKAASEMLKAWKR